MPKNVRSRRRPTTSATPPTEPTTNDDDAVDLTNTEVEAGTDLPKKPDGELITAKDIQLEAMRILQIQGKSQMEIAKSFGVSTRTIRNWDKQATKKKIPLGLKLTAEAEVSARMLRFTADEIELIELKQQAAKERDRPGVIVCLKELRILRSLRDKYLDKLGILAQFPLTTNDSDDGTDINQILSIINNRFATQDPDEER